MKSSRCSDEIFGFASDEIKSTLPPPRRISSNAVGFHHEVIYSTRRVDLAEKDIFGSFAYDFELSHKNEILASARTKSANADEIFGYASDEIKSTHPASSRISSNEVGFHRCRRFNPPARVDLVEKPTSRNLSVFLAESVRFELTVGRPITSFQDWLLKPLGQLSGYRKTALRRFLWRSERDLNLKESLLSLTKVYDFQPNPYVLRTFCYH